MADHQRYVNDVAINRMHKGLCPECGGKVEDHTGWGGPGCSLTDNGVAGRIYQYEQDLKAAREAGIT